MTFYLGLLLCASLGGLGVWLSRKSQAAGMLLLVASVVGGLGLTGWRFWKIEGGGGPAPLNMGLAALGDALGQQAQPLLKDRTGPIALVFPSEKVMDTPTRIVLREMFIRALDAADRPRVRELVMPIVKGAAPTNGVPLAEFERLLAGASAPAMIVSFAGVPKGIEAAAFAQRQPRAVVIAFEPAGGTDWAQPLRSGVLHRVVLPRPGTDFRKGTGFAGMPDELFARLYFSATAANVADIAAQLGSR